MVRRFRVKPWGGDMPSPDPFTNNKVIMVCES